MKNGNPKEPDSSTTTTFKKKSQKFELIMEISLKC